jgi:glycosyltransferase involved in cell wall biosynthesis
MTNHIRVLEIISGFAVEGPLGGIERFGIELCRALDRTRLEPIACGLWSYGTPLERRWVNQLTGEGIEAFIAAMWAGDAPYRSFWQALRGIRTVLAGQRVDIIHSHCQFGDVAALLLKRALGAQVVMRTVHNEREWVKRPLRRLVLTNWLYPLAFDAEIGVSQGVVDNLNQRPGAQLRGRRAHRIYNSLDLRRFSDVQVNRVVKKLEMGWLEDAPVIGSIGRLVKQKGFSVLLEAARLVLAHFPQVRFVIVGGGPLMEPLKAQACELGLEGQVIFTGPREDVEELLVMMDLFVSSSLWEGLPTVLLESMAAGVPVVATDVSGSREIIRPGLTGLLVPADNPVLLSEAIMSMVTERQRAAAMAERARSEVRTRFSIEIAAKLHTELYIQLFEEKGR